MKLFVKLVVNSFKSNLEHKQSRWGYTPQWDKDVITSLWSSAKSIRLMWRATRPGCMWIEMARVEYHTCTSDEDGIFEYEWHPSGRTSSEKYWGLEYYNCFLVVDRHNNERGMFPCPWAWGIGLPRLNASDLKEKHVRFNGHPASEEVLLTEW